MAQHKGSDRASQPAAPGLIVSIPKKCIFDIAEIYSWPCLERSGQETK